MQLSQLNNLTYPCTIKVTPVSEPIVTTINELDNSVFGFTFTDKVNSVGVKSCKHIKQPYGLDYKSNAILTITTKSFNHLLNWMYEYDLSQFDNPKASIVNGVSECPSFFTFLPVPEAIKIKSKEELVSCLTTFINGGLFIDTIDINNGEMLFNNIPWNEQGVYTSRVGASMVSPNGLIQNILRLNPVSYNKSNKVTTFKKYAPKHKSEVVLLKDTLICNATESIDVDEDCPACGEIAIIKADEPYCVNLACPSLRNSFLESIARQTTLPHDKIMEHYLDGTIIDYRHQIIDVQARQTVYVDRLRTFMDIMGDNSLVDVINYLYPSEDDTPFNTRFEIIDQLLIKHTTQIDDGMCVHLAKVQKKLQVMLLGDIPDPINFAIRMLLSAKGIGITNICGEATFVIVGDVEDRNDCEFYSYLVEVNNMYICRLGNDPRRVINNLKNIKDIYYLNDLT